MSYTPSNREGFIYEALCAQLVIACEGLGMSTDLVSWPGYPFTPPNDRKFLRVQYLPNQTERVAVDSVAPHRHAGILQVTVVWPENSGFQQPLDIAGQVADFFAADTRMVYQDVIVRSTKRPTIAPSMTDGADLLTPVSIEYESYI